MKHVYFLPYIFAMITGLTSYGTANAVTSPAFVSPYGQIQNVQNYSSNPFWTPDGGYRQNFPVPVYVTGPDVKTSDCTTAVTALISAYCGQNNNCRDLTLADVRPIIVLQLSRLPGHNYASSCIGYLDSEYDNYVKTRQNTIPNNSVAFPTGGTVANPNANGGYKIQLPSQPVPQWKTDMQQRHQELHRLQAQNGATYEPLTHTDFPLTYDDLSFTERMENEIPAYKPYRDKNPYNSLQLNEQTFVGKKTATKTTPQTQTQPATAIQQTPPTQKQSQPQSQTYVAASTQQTPPTQKQSQPQSQAYVATTPQSTPEPENKKEYSPVPTNNVKKVNTVAKNQTAALSYAPEIKTTTFSYVDSETPTTNDTPLNRCLTAIATFFYDNFNEASCCTVTPTKCEMTQNFIATHLATFSTAEAHIKQTLQTNSDCQKSISQLTQKIWLGYVAYPSSPTETQWGTIFGFNIKSTTDINTSIKTCYRYEFFTPESLQLQ